MDIRTAVPRQCSGSCVSGTTTTLGSSSSLKWMTSQDMLSPITWLPSPHRTTYSQTEVRDKDLEGSSSPKTHSIFFLPDSWGTLITNRFLLSQIHKSPGVPSRHPTIPVRIRRVLPKYKTYGNKHDEIL